ncbi:Plasmid stabilization system protein [Crenothrix polyspora]|uniref:Toxin n=1 Tax=Crenothrix polyspora TaxID=360316 RepID=A0A1R4H9M2_9GAMM|nr:type II toxin-antitoxin system RelE/ParE family toxin [Crenothrix polyspora]SJM92867.1 Plasmid stabilization system protein [Crenothrix polyspora]
MPRLLQRPEAESDLDEIWWYIAQDSPNNADSFLDRIQKQCVVLVDFPHMGTNRDEITTGLRSQPVGNYLIFYFPLDDGIEIIRVFHGSRDIDSLLSYLN